MFTTPVNASFKAPGPANIKQQIKPRPLGQSSQILFEIAALSGNVLKSVFQSAISTGYPHLRAVVMV